MLNYQKVPQGKSPFSHGFRIFLPPGAEASAAMRPIATTRSGFRPWETNHRVHPKNPWENGEIMGKEWETHRKMEKSQEKNGKNHRKMEVDPLVSSIKQGWLENPRTE